MSVGAKVLQLRTAQGLSREVVAVRAGIGSATVRRIEEGTHDTRIGTLEALAAALGVTASDLLDTEQPAAS